MPAGRAKKTSTSLVNRRSNKCIPASLYTLTSEREAKLSIQAFPSSQTSTDTINSEPVDLDDDLELFYRSMQRKLLRRSSLQKRAVEEQINYALAQTIETMSDHMRSLESSMYF